MNMFIAWIDLTSYTPAVDWNHRPGDRVFKSLSSAAVAELCACYDV